MSVSVSIVNGSGYLNHNERKFFRGNVHRERIKDNVHLKSESLENAYNRLFKNSVEAHNAKQKKPCRMKSVESYLESLEKNKHKKGSEKPFYEVIVQIGDKNTCGIEEHPQEAQKAKEALLEFANEFEKRNPNLKAFNVSLHMDESTPHLHIDYIPLADGYKNGMPMRNSLSKALEQQGLGKHISQYDNPAVRWQEQERKALIETAKKYGFEIEVKGVQREHLTVAEFKAVKDELNERLRANPSPKLDTVGAFGFKAISSESLKSLEQKAEIISKKEAILNELDGRFEGFKEELKHFEEEKKNLRQREAELNLKATEIEANAQKKIDLALSASKMRLKALEGEVNSLKAELHQEKENALAGQNKAFLDGKKEGAREVSLKIFEAHQIPVRPYAGGQIKDDVSGVRFILPKEERGRLLMVENEDVVKEIHRRLKKMKQEGLKEQGRSR